MEVGIAFFYLSQVCYTVLMNHLFNQFDVCIRCGCGLNDAIHGQDCLTDTERETLEARLTPLLDVPDEEGGNPMLIHELSLDELETHLATSQHPDERAYFQKALDDAYEELEYAQRMATALEDGEEW